MSKHKNIIWIFSDQQPAYTLGCNGDPNSHTPTLDRLAGDGFNFRNAVSGFPLCCPFRGALLTGLYPHNCGVKGHIFPLSPEHKTAADYFNGAGYHTAYFGKWHLHGVEGLDEPTVFEIPIEARGRYQRWIGYENNNVQYDCYVHGHLDQETPYPLTRLKGYETDSLTDYMLDYIKERNESDQPFFAVLSVQPPHNPYLAPPEYQRKYQAQNIKLRPNVANIPSVEEVTRLDLAGTYAMIENLDDNVGRVFNLLRELDLDKETWIFFFSDHGDMHGSQGQFMKTIPYQESSNVPFIVWSGSYNAPQGFYGQGNVPYPINHVDILPTSLGIADIEVPKELDGFDYSPVLRHEPLENPPVSAYLQNIVPTGHYHSFDRPYRGVVTLDNWKYVCTEHDDVMLYNLNEDIYEQQNLVFNPKWTQKRLELRQLVADWVTKTGDEFTMPTT